jgi:hypothetical protein
MFHVEKLITWVKVEMIRFGYANEDFITLEETFDSENASREILIAIGWLIFTHQLISLFIHNSNNFAEEEYFKSKVSTD